MKMRCEGCRKNFDLSEMSYLKGTMRNYFFCKSKCMKQFKTPTQEELNNG